MLSNEELHRVREICESDGYPSRKIILKMVGEIYRYRTALVEIAANTYTVRETINRANQALGDLHDPTFDMARHGEDSMTGDRW